MASPIHAKVAARYAKAISELVGTDTKTVISELKQFAEVVQGHEELSQVLESDVFSAQERKAIIEDLTKKMKLSSLVTKILFVVSESKRMGSLKAIAEDLRLLVLESAGVIPLRVQTTGDLTKDEKKHVEEKFKKILGKDVEASYELEPALVGGLRVTAGGRTYDGSVAGWLATLAEQLVGGTI
jgi:F-type H+-transporting ATPase subunit delta